tara:strand:+ start:2201 stop:2401 length:201 start_codon:yes stop_codon:yes gene_type:complete
MSLKIMGLIQLLLTAAFVVIAVIVVSDMDQRDVEFSQRIYCENVMLGAWPDYNKDVDCGWDQNENK